MDIPDGALYRLHRIRNALTGCLARLRLDLFQALGVELPFALVKAHAHTRILPGPFPCTARLLFIEFAGAFLSLARLFLKSTLGAAHLLIYFARHRIGPPGSTPPSALLEFGADLLSDLLAQAAQLLTQSAQLVHFRRQFCIPAAGATAA